MISLKAFRFKLVPTPTQERTFRQYAGACRWVWNEMLRERKETYKVTGKSPSMYEQMRRLTALKRQPETAWLNGIHSQVLQEPIKNLQCALLNFFEGRAKYPSPSASGVVLARSASRKELRLMAIAFGFQR